MNETVNKIVENIMEEIQPNLIMLGELGKEKIKTLNSYEKLNGSKVIGEEEKQQMITREYLKIKAILKCNIDRLF